MSKTIDLTNANGNVVSLLSEAIAAMKKNKEPADRQRKLITAVFEAKSYNDIIDLIVGLENEGYEVRI